MKEYQTPQRQDSLSSDLIIRGSKESLLTNQKKKCLNSCVISVSDDQLPELSESSAVTQISEAKSDDTAAGSFLGTLNPALSAGPEAVSLSDFTPSCSGSAANLDNNTQHLESKGYPVQIFLEQHSLAKLVSQ